MPVNLTSREALRMFDLADIWATRTGNDVRLVSANDHVAFGGTGVHYCLGANLARAEIRAIMRQLVDRLDGFTPAGEPRRLRSDFVNGVKSMPITFTRR